MNGECPILSATFPLASISSKRTSPDTSWRYKLNPKAGDFVGKDGLVNYPLSRHRCGLYYRSTLSDKLSIIESLRNYKAVQVQNRTVIDIGANIGAFTHMAVKGNAACVFAYEPEPYTFAMLRHNVGAMPCVLFNSAVTTSADPLVRFYVGTGNGAPSLASTTPRRGRREIVVNNTFCGEVFSAWPDTLKIDIEGGEYDLVPHLPKSCDELAIEWHCLDHDQLAAFERVYPRFLKQGWSILRESKREMFKKASKAAGKAPWFTIDGHYRR